MSAAPDTSNGGTRNGGTGTGTTSSGVTRSGRVLLAGANPLAKLAAVVLITAVLAVSIDWVSSSVALACEALLAPLAGLGLRLLWQRGWPLIMAAVVGGYGTAVVAPDSGPVLLNAWIWTVSSGSLQLGLGVGLRALAIALPAVMLMTCTDPTDLADALAQKARLPHRFVLGSLAAMRLVGLMVEEWKTLGMARRARGVGTHGNAAARLTAAAGQGFSLLVQAVRRASRLAITMEARGFGAGPRTWARQSVWRPVDAAVVLVGLVIAVASALIGSIAGTWHIS
jgi:energy-coupling factor transport system permease protein